jgi:hypothetical protein
MKQQVIVEMTTMPTNRADDTPITSGISRRSAAGNRRESHVTFPRRPLDSEPASHQRILILALINMADGGDSLYP